MKYQTVEIVKKKQHDNPSGIARKTSNPVSTKISSKKKALAKTRRQINRIFNLLAFFLIAYYIVELLSLHSQNQLTQIFSGQLPGLRFLYAPGSYFFWHSLIQPIYPIRSNDFWLLVGFTSIILESFIYALCCLKILSAIVYVQVVYYQVFKCKVSFKKMLSILLDDIYPYMLLGAIGTIFLLISSTLVRF